ncbi:hypothetical protein SCLCIDRAFT_280520 [Scleroderma citrinum Foug A]|uniref:Uncharacterized protein n=1 Tax=Scleroderma citrinum Foug A TaxID=1036808 RepID=A0A0C3DIE3_9AGAM|nr:hypothetical protein SCLCIDRAFT_280520 [Scleroderma citrinum Foug A]
MKHTHMAAQRQLSRCDHQVPRCNRQTLDENECKNEAHILNYVLHLVAKVMLYSQNTFHLLFLCFKSHLVSYLRAYIFPHLLNVNPRRCHSLCAY